jgi:hypothetical protein
MKIQHLILFAIIALTACHNSEREQRLKDLSVQDSTLLQQARLKDSSISSYIHTMNIIQDNLDSIKRRERMLSIYSSEKGSNTDKIIADIKSMDELILKNNREITSLQARIKKMDTKNVEIEKIVAHLNKELQERDSNIASLQSTVSKSNASLKDLVEQYNDSVITMQFQRAENKSLKTEINTVYYAVGTIKELKEKGVIDKKGGVAGIGSTVELKQNFNNTYFTKADKTNLGLIPLKGKFSKIVTDHPNTAFKVTESTKSDSLLITNPDSFWSESKYLIVVVK